MLKSLTRNLEIFYKLVSVNVLVGERLDGRLQHVEAEHLLIFLQVELFASHELLKKLCENEHLLRNKFS